MSLAAKKYVVLKANAKVKQEPAEVWCLTKHRWYRWGKNQCMKHKLKDPVYNLLEVIISTCNLKHLSKATVETLLATYNKKHPNHTISRATLYRYLDQLIQHKIIKRYDQKEYNRSVITRLLAPKLVDSSVSSCDTNNLSPDKLTNSAPPLPSAGSLVIDLSPEERQKAKTAHRAKLKDLARSLNSRKTPNE